MDHESHYSKAPITEAILDIQVEAHEGLTATLLAGCQDSVRSDYPTKRELKAAFAHFEVGAQLAASTTSQDLGFAFVSQDGKQLFQVRNEWLHRESTRPLLALAEIQPRGPETLEHLSRNRQTAPNHPRRTAVHQPNLTFRIRWWN